MSNLKRKDAPGDQPSSKIAKKPKATAPKDELKPEAATPSFVSLLKNDEPLFPRGGGNVLTPLEQKQIQLEAKADAFREEQAAATGKPLKKKKSSTKTTTKSKKTDDKPTESSVKVESLNYKVRIAIHTHNLDIAFFFFVVH